MRPPVDGQSERSGDATMGILTLEEIRARCATRKDTKIRALRKERNDLRRTAGALRKERDYLRKEVAYLRKERDEAIENLLQQRDDAPRRVAR